MRALRWVGVLGLVALPACSPGTVRISYRPAVGEVVTYRTSVRAVTVTRIGDEAARRREASSTLTARHRVLSSGAEGAEVEVRLSQEGVAPSTFLVRFDRAGQLVGVERIEGLPADALGDLGLSEILPASAAAPPRRALAPGETWEIDEPVALPSASSAARVTGRGRLVALGVDGGRRVARVDSRYRLPVRQTAGDTGGRLALEGSLDTAAVVSYDLDDDQVHAVESRSTGRYAVTLLPPAGVAGVAGVAVPGTLEVDVTATTRRAG